jgi:hypothetical protein
VLEQDRVAVEAMEPEANQREFLYSHDMGLVRERRIWNTLANEQTTDRETQRCQTP